MRESGRYLPDSRICALQRKIKSLDSDIEALLMERIQDKANVARYDSLIAKLSSEQTAARQRLNDLQSRDASLRREIKTAEKHIAELGTVLEYVPIGETIMHRLIDHIDISQSKMGLCVCYVEMSKQYM